MPALGLQGRWENRFDIPSTAQLRAVPQRQMQDNRHYLYSYEAQSELGLESRPLGALSLSAPLDSFWTLPPVFRLCSTRESRSTTKLTHEAWPPRQEDDGGQLPFGKWLVSCRPWCPLAPPPDAQTALPLPTPQATHTSPHALHVGCQESINWIKVHQTAAIKLLIFDAASLNWELLPACPRDGSNLTSCSI